MKRERIYGLDILRACAILFVILDHLYFYLPIHTSYTSYLAFIPDGVSIFFVLSGFLIGGILIKIIHARKFNFYELRHFWARRWLRTLPAYLVILVIIIVIDLRTGNKGWLYYGQYVFFVQNLHNGFPPLFPESWSLSIEEWFYLLIPMALFILLRLETIPRQTILLICICSIIIAVSIARAIKATLLSTNDPIAWDIFNRQLFLRPDSIMYGVLGAYLHFYTRLFKKNNLLCFLGVMLLFLPNIYSALFGLNAVSNCIFVSVKSIGTLLLLPTLVSWQTGKGIVFTFFTYVSKVSYSMYLTNVTPFIIIGLPLINKLEKNSNPLSNGDMIKAAGFLIWTAAASYLLYRLIEKPFMGWRDRMYRSKTMLPVKESAIE